MITHPYLEQGVSIFNVHLHSPARVEAGGPHAKPQPFITLSRESAAGATTLGHELVPLLDHTFGGDRGWFFLDKDLLVQALTQHHLPARLAAFLPEDRISEIQAAIGEIVGLHPPLWELEQKVADAIFHLAQMGRVILAGRAANVITRPLSGGLRVRLVAPTHVRVARLAALRQCPPEDAARHVAQVDHARRRYFRARTGCDIEDAHLYDLTINTENLSPPAIARLVVTALVDRMERVHQPHPAVAPAAGEPRPPAPAS